MPVGVKGETPTVPEAVCAPVLVKAHRSYGPDRAPAGQPVTSPLPSCKKGDAQTHQVVSPELVTI